ncbi:hypothetical protein G7062_05405 [Erysipelothrix sp. HDW6C]|uniref:hypothetical protein n=1 Tax=Erysipelothrix sp. HDW6C TaxID=2714930 RepID=UPI00140DEC3C|nr:hypothetical protein [Erysipelothrix sp. HDW6C]QIK69768.1 hypothetical protein G7062_05405 [Erysipelothrix sp. HDW6C]
MQSHHSRPTPSVFTHVATGVQHAVTLYGTSFVTSLKEDHHNHVVMHQRNAYVQELRNRGIDFKDIYLVQVYPDGDFDDATMFTNIVAIANPDGGDIPFTLTGCFYEFTIQGEETHIDLAYLEVARWIDIHDVKTSRCYDVERWSYDNNELIQLDIMIRCDD